MPRLRYKKSYDFTLYESEDERSDQENESGGNEEESSGRSWLSNAVIASQLSDAKIKEAIAALKAQITILESELLSRRLSNSSTARKSWDKIGQLRGPAHAEKLWNKPTKRRTATATQFQKLSAIRSTLAKLGVKNVDELIATWSKINEKEK